MHYLFPCAGIAFVRKLPSVQFEKAYTSDKYNAPVAASIPKLHIISKDYQLRQYGSIDMMMIACLHFESMQHCDVNAVLLESMSEGEKVQTLTFCSIFQ